MFFNVFLCIDILSTIKLKNLPTFLNRKTMTWIVNVALCLY